MEMRNGTLKRIRGSQSEPRRSAHRQRARGVEDVQSDAPYSLPVDSESPPEPEQESSDEAGVVEETPTSSAPSSQESIVVVVPETEVTSAVPPPTHVTASGPSELRPFSDAPEIVLDHSTDPATVRYELAALPKLNRQALAMVSVFALLALYRPQVAVMIAALIAGGALGLSLNGRRRLLLRRRAHLD